MTVTSEFHAGVKIDDNFSKEGRRANEADTYTMTYRSHRGGNAEFAVPQVGAHFSSEELVSSRERAANM